MYEILLERSVEKDLGKLEPALFRRVVAALRQLASNPFPAGCRKIVGSQSDWRIRVGDYRAIYEVNQRSRVVRVLRVRHRREVYR